jgi:hypothetical protein
MGWQKSSRSPEGNSCVEAMPMTQFRTSSHSGNGGNCVEVAQAGISATA